MAKRRRREPENWFHNKWRPAMAWSYLIICMFDFMIGPIMYGIIFADKVDFIQWIPLTTRGGGIYHASMLTVLGVTAWGRTQEKLKMFRADSDPFDGVDDSGEYEVEKTTETLQTVQKQKESDSDMSKPMRK